jgi:hypothetical protein
MKTGVHLIIAYIQFHLTIQFLPERINSVSTEEITQLIVFKETVNFDSENRTEMRNILLLYPVVHIVTTGL